ncbi:hypothetical protein PQR21_00530 [Paraburkholderia nemoris]|uniref:hypothetical protein n=1 Tax=Paraburkholderia nemoris TaxID=2793076 RepID=UPI0038BB02F4
MRSFVVGLASILLFSHCIVQANPSQALRELVVEAHSNPTVNSVHVAPDSSILLAGQSWSAHSAYAARISANGQMLWRITAPSEAPPEDTATRSSFNDSLVFSDGTAVLCGHIGVKRSAPQPGVLLFVDKNGATLHETRIYPGHDDTFKLSDVAACLAWQGGILTVGKTLKFRPVGALPRTEAFYWVTFSDTAGNLKWEHIIPAGIDRIDSIDSLTTTSDGRVIFTGSFQSTQSATELVRVGKDGTVSGGTVLPGLYLLVQSSVPTKTVRLMSKGPSMNWEVVSFDEQLRLAGRLTASQRLDAIPRAIFQAASGTFFVFGEAAPNSRPTGASVMRLSADLRSIRTLTLSSIADSYNVDAVAYNPTRDQFVMAYRFLRSHEQSSGAGTSLTFLDRSSVDGLVSTAEAANAVPVSSSSSGTQNAGPPATDAQVQQLLAFQQLQFHKTPNVGANANVSDCVARNTRNVDPGNPAWNAGDPRWATISGVIGRDCIAQHKRLTNEIVPAVNSAMHDALARGYATRLSKADADALIRYYRSDEGRHFLDFQLRVSRAIGLGVGQTFASHAASSVDKPAADVMKARMALLQLSRLFATQIVTSEDDRAAGHDTSGAPAIAIMAVAVATTQGEALDEIRHAYSDDLPGFATFVASPEEKRELRVFGEAGASMVNVASGPARAMDPASNGNLQKWRDLYHSLPASGGAISRQ